MNKNNPNVNEKDDDLDLSSMINEYEEDNVLRQKIEQMKKQKEEEAIQRNSFKTVDSTRFALVTEEEEAAASAKETQEKETSKTTFLDVDEDLGRTREINVNGELNKDVDKTLVIMDNQRQRIFESESADQDTEEDESILVYGNHEVDEEEITDEDIEEFLGDEDVKKKAKKEIDPKKMNKIITYVISGVVALILLVGVGFGVKYALDSFSGDEEKASETEKTKDKDKAKDKEKETNKDKPKETDDKKDDEDSNNQGNTQTNTNPSTTDNSVRIAEIKGAIKGKNELINQHKGKIADLTNKRDAVGYNPDNEDLVRARTDMESAALALQTIKTDYTALQATCDALTNNPEEGKDTQAACQAAATKKAELDTATATLKEKTLAFNNLDSDNKNKKQEYDDYNNQITSINDQITVLNNEITALQNELSSLQ